MGEVYRPKDILQRRKVPDLGPIPKPVSTISLQEILHEVRELRAELEKIKSVLRAKGIQV